MRRIVLLALLPLLALCGCASTVGRVTSTYDKFKDSRYDEMVISPSGTRLIRLQEGRATPSFSFMFPYLFSGKRGPSNPRLLIFIADGKKIELAGGSKVIDVDVSQNGVTYGETAVFPVSPSEILTLANSTNTEYRLYMNRPEDPQGPVTEASKKAMKQFYDQFVVGAPSPVAK